MLALTALLSLSVLSNAQARVQKLGVYDYFTEESSPVIFNGALLMLESIPTAYAGYDPAFSRCSSYLRVRDMRTLSTLVNITLSCGMAFGAATVLPGAAPGASDTLLVTATQWDRRSAARGGALGSAWSGPCAGAAPTNCSVFLFFSSARDLADASWAARAPGVPLPFGVYNTDPMAVPRAAGLPWQWVMALETTAETARFLASAAGDPTDAAAWQVLDATHTVPRYADTGSCPSLRHDGEFFYYLTGGRDIHVLRSRDLVAWEPPRTVLNHSAPGDCVVAPAFFGPYVPQGEAAQRLAACGAGGTFGDDSDVDLVAWPAPFGSGPPGVLLEYGSGDQRTFGFSNLALAANTTMEAFLQGFFA